MTTVAALAPILRPAMPLLVGRTGAFSDLIRRITDSQFSHVAMVGESAGAWIVLEATDAGVAARKIETILDDPTVVQLALMDHAFHTMDQRVDIVRAMWLETGRAYSMGVNWNILTHVPVNWQGAAREGVNCAEAVGLAYLAGVGWAPVDLTRPTPEGFWRSPQLAAVWQWQAPPAPVADPPAEHVVE